MEDIRYVSEGLKETSLSYYAALLLAFKELHVSVRGTKQTPNMVSACLVVFSLFPLQVGGAARGGWQGHRGRRSLLLLLSPPTSTQSNSVVFM